MKYETQSKLAPVVIILVGLCILAVMFFLPSQTTTAYADEPSPGVTPVPNSPYFTSTTTTLASGQSVDRYSINGPSHPPAGFDAQRMAAQLSATASMLTVPAYDWVYGCSAVSASMIAGYYDRNGYPNMYTGPTASGVMPLDNSSWPTWVDSNGDTYPNLPLAASHNGVDGRATRGSIDDYWVSYGSGANDPYVTGGWAQHTWGTAVGDYMKTGQAAYGNTDGSTAFYNYTSSSAALTCADMVSGGISTVDGTYGRKLFYEARGYTVTDCYNQKTDNNGGGFTYAMYKAQIDAGRPILLNLAGHSIVGVGYDPASTTIYVHDTWDYLNHSMTWGSSYAGMSLLSVSVVNLQGSTPPSVVPTPKAPTGKIADKTPTYKWTKVSGATKYRIQLKKGTKVIYAYAVPASACGSTVCTKTPTTKLTNASYKWRVQAMVGGAWKAYSVYKSFTINTKPKAGYWSGSFNSFYVTPSQTYVKNFKISISVPACGITGTITRTTAVPIVSKKFSFGGSFYANGAFSTIAKGSGQTGLSSFYISGCGYVSGGPWAWTATWKNTTQPTYVLQKDLQPSIFQTQLLQSQEFDDSITIDVVVP